MPPRARIYFSFLGFILLITSAVPLYREFSRPRDIWWTPAALMVPLAESKDRVMIYARGKALADRIEAGEVRLEENGTSSTLTGEDIGLRFNNWDRMRAERIPLMLLYAAACGISAFSILLALTGRLAYRPEKEPPARS